GIVLFSYFVDRSAPHILPYVSLPLLMAATLWLSLLTRGALTPSRFARMAGLGFALTVSVLVVSVAWSSIAGRFPRTALARLPPGERLLTQTAALRMFESLRAHPSPDPLRDPRTRAGVDPLQAWVLQAIGQRFDLRVLYRGGQEFVVAALTPGR